jgi:hypothetical protein
MFLGASSVVAVSKPAARPRLPQPSQMFVSQLRTIRDSARTAEAERFLPAQAAHPSAGGRKL